VPEFLKKYLNQIKEFWGSLDKSQKTRLYVTSGIVIVAITISIILLTKPNRIVLFTNSNKSQIGEMMTVLDDNGIWNEARNDGTTIIIDAKNNNKAQIALAKAGYPKEGFTFEDAISKIGITTTQSDRKAIWKQQEISNLESKIEMLDNIDEAAVTLAIPETSIFYSDEQEQPKSTAYVMVRPKPNTKLTPAQVDGVVMLVSRSVENLDPSDVTVVDNNGNILNTESLDESIYKANSQEEMRKARESELEQKILDYFNVEQHDSFDTLRVVVHATLDFDSEKTSSKTIKNPEGMDGGALISGRKSEERIKNGSAAGEPGLEANPGDNNSPTYMIGEGQNSDYSNVEEEYNYGYDEEMTETQKATGKLVPQESSVAISLWYGREVHDDSKLDENFLNEVKSAASAATGIPVKNVVVNKLKLAQSKVIEKTLGDRINELLQDYGFLALMLILVITLAIAIIPKKEKGPEEVMQVAAAGVPKFVVPEPEPPLPDIELEEKSEIKKQIENFVKKKPDSVAQLLRNWLSDDWDG
jgi:flagellar M-ring protein FliF